MKDATKMSSDRIIIKLIVFMASSALSMLLVASKLVGLAVGRRSA